MDNVEELSNEILRHLRADFVARSPTSNDLADGYVGPNLAILKTHFSDNGASSVDFDLAMKELEEAGLVETGPLVPFDNHPGSSVVVIGLFSNREYAFLTEKGYKAAQQPGSSRKPRGTTNLHVNISGGHFQQSPIGIGDHINQSISSLSGAAPVFRDLHRVVNESGIDAGDRKRLLAAIENMEKAHNTPSFRDRYREFIALAADYMTLIGPYVPALAGLLTTLKP